MPLSFNTTTMIATNRKGGIGKPVIGIVETPGLGISDDIGHHDLSGTG